MNIMKEVPKGNERSFDRNEFIVSKTDIKGAITYVNHVFISVSGYTEIELIGQPHNCIRHPDMPRCIFKLAWERIGKGHEIFAYVKNLCKNGDYYWVLAHMVPSYDLDGNHVGYHSSRRAPDKKNINAIEPIYQKLLDIEQESSDRKKGLEDSYAYLKNFLKEQNLTYDQFIFSQI